MKNICLYVWGLLMLLVSCTPENRVIDKPVFLASNTTSIEVSKVTLTDSTTVLDIFARYTPGWWIKIASTGYLADDKGNTYPIQAGIGVELDKEFWMPESGEAEFQIVFPPLKRGAKYIDYIEAPDVEGGFIIWGIQLKDNQLPELKFPKGFKETEVDKNAPLPEVKLAYGQATIKGYILDYREGMPDKVTLHTNNPFGLNDDVELEITPDGTFSYSINVLGVNTATIRYMKNTFQFAVAPENTTEICLNIREVSRYNSKYHAEKPSYGKSIYYNGPLAGIMMELPQVMDKINEKLRTMRVKPEVMIEYSVEDLKQHELSILANMIEVINQTPISDAAKKLMINIQSVNVLFNLLVAPSDLTSAYRSVKGDMVSHEELNAIYEKHSKSISDDYLPDDLCKLLNSSSAMFSSVYGYMFRFASPSLLKKVGDGLFNQLDAASKIAVGLSDFQPLTEVQKEEMKALPEACQQYLNAKNEELLATIEANKKKTGFRVNETGEVADEDLFASIISKFDGKVRLVDFWATWCGPCRMANKEMIPMKEELKDKDIVYIYITGETSPKGTWENMIPDIHGEHFRVTDKQWSYLCDKYGVEGVPTYIVVDTEGEIKYKSVGFPGVSKMKEELLKVAK